DYYCQSFDGGNSLLF
nr:immunoglobulin light chain junction region [Macaca mulatta]MOX13067.1 immunoglobulin light chain junction region [Macaca mulatta]MOX13604.1 immunoglobulin light chain junction region [Macaca mulatta]MOX13655.1 immunoglobulin light chain junction region [Macaca mulatta]MOY14640.1 immunoglobulin light chain junction region [Macaca mulatta]